MYTHILSQILGRVVGEPTVSMIRALAYDPSGVIYFKTGITDDYDLLPQRSVRRTIAEIPAESLHKEKIPLTKKKWDHLQDLKRFLPSDCHYFYDKLPFRH